MAAAPHLISGHGVKMLQGQGVSLNVSILKLLKQLLFI